MTTYIPKVGDLCIYQYAKVATVGTHGTVFAIGAVLVRIVNLPVLAESHIRFLNIPEMREDVSALEIDGNNAFRPATQREIIDGLKQGIKKVEEQIGHLKITKATLRLLLKENG